MEDRVLNQLISWSRNPEVQKSLISQDNALTVAAAVEIAMGHEATSKYMKTLAEHSKSYQEDKNKNFVTIAENSTGEINVQPTVHLVENVAKPITGNLCAAPAPANSLIKEQSQSLRKLFTRVKIGLMTMTMMTF